MRGGGAVLRGQFARLLKAYGVGAVVCDVEARIACGEESGWKMAGRTLWEA
jgi:hypothetical protein